MADEKVNQMRGYKATLNNPRVSDEAKQHAQDVLDNELGGDQPHEEILTAQGARDKSPNRVAGGYKAAMSNDSISKQGKKQAKEKLAEMPQE
ncbi:Con-6 family protein [Aspergillus mulundensis]|uniref:Conidiation-specific protein 6 n=1 Tax=Aspergillus mulundensis TaxID=1810919 RepID=A0A3D8RF68_9EURO|nr:hypothetical protein DSM5745_07865 [Aspergillus mulundensis]RDW72693.1 hypothetical protein DSM5745_07865 [Aspergillus mulundensis]